MRRIGRGAAIRRDPHKVGLGHLRIRQGGGGDGDAISVAPRDVAGFGRHHPGGVEALGSGGDDAGGHASPPVPAMAASTIQAAA